jgi:hypothetical protein
MANRVGRPSLGHTSTIELGIGPKLDNALTSLAKTSGISRAALVRAALTSYLIEKGALVESDLIIRTPTQLH